MDAGGRRNRGGLHGQRRCATDRPRGARGCRDRLVGDRVSLAVSAFRIHQSRLSEWFRADPRNSHGAIASGLEPRAVRGGADGIEPVSAILAGLPGGLIERNLDAQLLSPATLLASAAGMPVTLVRSDPKTGRTQRLPGVILSGASADGVVLQTQAGIEALRCSGLPEGFAFDADTTLGASPTLSVLLRSEVALTARIELSYLAHGFDWAADYTATLSGDAKTIDLGAWVTLANGNGVGFPSARTQVVAGRLNREGEASTPLDRGGPVLARCWPRGSTSDTVGFLVVTGAVPAPFNAMKQGRAVMLADAAMAEVSVTGARVGQEQLGDLKLYRVPDRTTVASRQASRSGCSIVLRFQ